MYLALNYFQNLSNYSSRTEYSLINCVRKNLNRSILQWVVLSAPCPLKRGIDGIL